MNDTFNRFSNLCALFDQIQNCRGTDLKKQRFRKYLMEWRTRYGNDFYEPMRLLLPHVSSACIFHFRSTNRERAGGRIKLTYQRIQVGQETLPPQGVEAWDGLHGRTRSQPHV